MSYLYGDATPFPLDENFIDTLTALTDACVSLFQVENAGGRRRHDIAQAQSLADAQIAHLKNLGDALDKALGPFVQLGKASAAGIAAAEIAAAAKASVRRGAAGCTSKRDEVVRSARSIDVASEVRKACGQFFTHHQLPETKWGLEWRHLASTEQTELQVFGYSPGDIRLTFRGGIPSDSPWSEPLKISELESELDITVSKTPGILGKATRTEHFHKMWITSVTYVPGHYAITVSPNIKKPGPSFQIAIKDGDRAVPYLKRTSGDGDNDGEREPLTGANAEKTARLWDHVHARLSGVPPMRASLQSVRLGAKASGDCDQPRRIAELCLRSVAPIVREMRKRSRVPGELALKRELGGGRREELFVPRVQLAEKFSSLPDDQRRVFEGMGLSAAPTQEHLAAPPAVGDTLSDAPAAPPAPPRREPPIPPPGDDAIIATANESPPIDDDGTTEIVLEASSADDER